ncbi:HigA family addiction module antitoxin [Roseospira visakhapatnamensis]|uniref:Addiction module HigA family antidote n=1 Tax=Roseospira visakhapatnamensis TaxID=390880 RepID=A0A7W6RG78_9PROT|nr:HigA family addiction module antitoxin [Roseospira visakhapatnamensis]MBB4267999.1 addiction module HigA family antidote [Roseospira visakhapatnamensis]
MDPRDLPPVHPGEQLREEFMAPLNLSAYALAKATHVPVSRIQAIIAEQRAITGDTALRLARYFGTTPEFWLNLQRDYDLEQARIETGAEIAATIRPRAA